MTKFFLWLICYGIVVIGIFTFVYFANFPNRGLVLYVVLLAAIFMLRNINMYLQGMQTARNTCILEIIIFVVVTLSFVIFGWEIGLAIIFVQFVIGKLFLIPGNRIASRILGYRVGLQEIEYGGCATSLHYELAYKKRKKENLILIKKLSKQKLKNLLEANGSSIEEILEEKSSLILNGFNHSLACEMFGSSRKLRIYFAWKSKHADLDFPSSVFILRKMLM